MLSILSDTQKAIVETVTMRLHLPQALEFLQDAGFKMSRRTYYRHKKKIEDMVLERMHHIAKIAYKEQHLERLDRLELAEKLMWDNYHLEEDPSKKVKILESIINIQPYVSGYYDSTRYVLEETVKADEDLHRNKRPYVGIDVEKLRRKEFEQEAQERRSNMIKERQEQAALQNAFQDDSKNVNFATVQNKHEIESESWANAIDTDTSIEKQPIQEQPEKQESATERYWRTHNPKAGPKGYGIKYTSL